MHRIYWLYDNQQTIRTAVIVMDLESEIGYAN